MTAGHPHCLHAGVGVAGPAGCVAPRGRRHELLLLWGPSFLHWVNMFHLCSRVGPTGGWSCIELQPVACSCGWAKHWIATRTCLGSSAVARVGRWISVLTRGSVGGSAFPSTTMALKVGAVRVVLALVLRRVAVGGTVIRHWCGGRGFAGRAGLQTGMRMAARWPWRQT